MSGFLKDPNARLDYQVDWAEWLAASETITTSTWVVPTGLTTDANSNTTTAATIWLLGGTAGQGYRVTNRITTNQGRADDRSIEIRVQER